MGAAGDLANSSRLSFDHSVQTEIGFDGGTVQISKDGGTNWITVPAAAYEFNPPTVLATAAAGNTNPLKGQPGFTGTDGGKTQSDWGTSIIDLSDPALAVANGSAIKVRFAIGRDGCGGVVGWFVDNIRVTTCKTGVAATVAAVHAPEPSTFGSASAVNVTVSGAGGTPSGKVTVKEGSNTLGTANLDAAGKASVALPASLPVGTHSLTIHYAGDATFGSANGAVTATVKAPSSAAATTTTASATEEGREGQVRQGPGGGHLRRRDPGRHRGDLQGLQAARHRNARCGRQGDHQDLQEDGQEAKKGKNTLTAKYLGSTTFLASQATFVVKVKSK